jgi:hypothetical protein
VTQVSAFQEAPITQREMKYRDITFHQVKVAMTMVHGPGIGRRKRALHLKVLGSTSERRQHLAFRMTGAEEFDRKAHFRSKGHEVP